MVIVDASVVFKWLANEDPLTTSKAREMLESLLLDAEEALAPDILLYEIGNILAYKTKLEEKDIQVAWKRFTGYPVKFLYPDSNFINKCLKFSKKYAVTIYDASYIILAEERGCLFFTTDQKLIDKINLPFVKYLGDYQ